MKTDEYTPSKREANASNSDQNKKATTTSMAANSVDKKYAAEPTQKSSKHIKRANQKNKNSNVM
jgi:hypothetical protein